MIAWLSANIGTILIGLVVLAVVIAIALLACMIYLLVRKNPYDDEHLTQKVSM